MNKKIRFNERRRQEILKKKKRDNFVTVQNYIEENR